MLLHQFGHFVEERLGISSSKDLDEFTFHVKPSSDGLLEFEIRGDVVIIRSPFPLPRVIGSLTLEGDDKRYFLIGWPSDMYRYSSPLCVGSTTMPVEIVEFDPHTGEVETLGYSSGSPGQEKLLLNVISKQASEER